MQNRYKLIQFDNGESFNVFFQETQDYWDISNSKEEILQLYEDAKIEKEALEKYPIEMMAESLGKFYVDVNKEFRLIYIEALKSNKAKYTIQDMEKCFQAGQDYENFDCKYAFNEYISHIQPKLEPVEIELEMEEILFCNKIKDNKCTCENIDLCIDGKTLIQPKITDNKITIVKIIL